MRFRERLARFMYGRYGTDELYYLLFFSGLFFTLISVFFRRLPLVYTVLYILSAVLLFVAIYRSFSRNISRRRVENQRFLRFCERWRARFRLCRNRIREGKTHVFRRCKKCKAVLRLPRRRGRHAVKCPCCQERFRVFIWFGKKNKTNGSKTR